jgi:transcriptional regulator with XRE-family HTH domain
MPRPIEPSTLSIRQVQDALLATGQLVARARKARRWTQAELGERLGNIDRRHISALEKGQPHIDFGLVVSALWLLDLPILLTLPNEGQASARLNAKDLLLAVSEQIAKGQARPTRNKPEISNDF